MNIHQLDWGVGRTELQKQATFGQENSKTGNRIQNLPSFLQAPGSQQTFPWACSVALARWVGAGGLALSGSQVGVSQQWAGNTLTHPGRVTGSAPDGGVLETWAFQR